LTSGKGFNPRRGLEYFFIGLVVWSITASISALGGAPASFPGAVAFVFGVSVLGGVIGMFAKNVPF
jgi:hypothetical protein